jgi:hypothetical protein
MILHRMHSKKANATIATIVTENKAMYCFFYARDEDIWISSCGRVAALLPEPTRNKY